jgi:hypothetical protein
MFRCIKTKNGSRRKSTEVTLYIFTGPHKYFRMCIVHLFNSSRHSELEELIKNLEAEKAAKDEELAALIKSNEVKLQDLNEQFRRQITEQINRSNELHTKIAVQVSNVLKLSVLQTIWCSLSML